jgi:hypothetical protein
MYNSCDDATRLCTNNRPAETIDGAAPNISLSQLDMTDCMRTLPSASAANEEHSLCNSTPALLDTDGRRRAYWAADGEDYGK